MQGRTGLRACLCLGVAAGLSVSPTARTGSFSSLGPCEETTTLPVESPTPPRELRCHHDGTFEDAFCFQLGGVSPPTYGAFAEGFTSRREDYLIEDIVLWVTQVGYHGDEPFDLYIWEGGVLGPPGLVRYHASDRTLENVPMWPLVAENHLNVLVALPEGNFSVGFWADFSQICCTWFIAADRSGEPGSPWVNVAPGTGFPSGWRHPELLWAPPVRSLGLGVTVVPFGTSVPEPAPREDPSASTWGQIKSLYR